MKKTLARLGLVFLGCLVALLGCEAFLRLRGKPIPLSHEHFLIVPQQFVADPDVVMVFPHYVQSEFYAGERARRGRRPLVLCLGDSFTQGFPVSAQDSYPAALERLVPEACVVNLGVGDSGPDRQLALFERHALPALHPDVVVWSFYANDVWDNLEMPVYDLDAQGRLVFRGAQDSWIVRRQQRCLRYPGVFTALRASYLARSLMRRMEPRPRHREEWATRKIRLEVEEMRKLAQENGFRLVLVNIPPEALTLGQQGTAIEHGYRALRETLAPWGPLEVPVPPDDSFFAQPDRDHNATGDRHYNEKGYLELARFLAPAVRAALPGGN